MSTQHLRRARTRERLLEAGVNVLIDRGLDGFTSTAVAARANVSQGSVFQHFPTKQALLVATVEAALRTCRTDHQANFVTRMETESPGDTLQTARIALETLWGACTDPRTLAVIEARARCRTDEDLRTALEPIIEADNAAGGENIAVLLPEVFSMSTGDYLETSRIVLNAMQGRALARLARPDPERDRQLVESLILLVQQRYAPAARPATEQPVRTSDQTAPHRSS